jgi:hypothetical protein
LRVFVFFVFLPSLLFFFPLFAYWVQALLGYPFWILWIHTKDSQIHLFSHIKWNNFVPKFYISF